MDFNLNFLGRNVEQFIQTSNTRYSIYKQRKKGTRNIDSQHFVIALIAVAEDSRFPFLFLIRKKEYRFEGKTEGIENRMSFFIVNFSSRTRILFQNHSPLKS